MRKWTYAVALALICFVTPVHAANPFSGTWKLNPAKSKFTAGAPAKQETATIEPLGDQDQITISGTAADGSPMSMKYTVPVKGGAGKVLAGPYDNVSGKTLSDNSREVNYIKGGQGLLHLAAVVSRDGKTMRVTVKGTDAQGKPVSGVVVFEKQ